ncbi:hypothetical protein SP15_084 [Bacillus phage SP-15]|uniref:Uncharacterized protein n=1 Tax=Bacillus phage SP-15 TaxID=1792032 RepID=A0A127AWC9_9CAUD|nr:hypothetical protein SP15_084 [Bacillus phage SP-15]AMM44883.1 hypothetical protein SP15_084 [Bacillus phage SP-15]
MLVKNIIDVHSRKQLDRLEKGDPVEVPGVGFLVPSYRKVAPTPDKRGYTIKFKVDLNAKLKTELGKKLETNEEFRRKLDMNK